MHFRQTLCNVWTITKNVPLAATSQLSLALTVPAMRYRLWLNTIESTTIAEAFWRLYEALDEIRSRVG